MFQQYLYVPIAPIFSSTYVILYLCSFVSIFPSTYILQCLYYPVPTYVSQDLYYLVSTFPNCYVLQSVCSFIPSTYVNLALLCPSTYDLMYPCSLFLSTYFPKNLSSLAPIFPRTYVPLYLCSLVHVSICFYVIQYLHSLVPTLYFPVSTVCMFPNTYILQYIFSFVLLFPTYVPLCLFPCTYVPQYLCSFLCSLVTIFSVTYITLYLRSPIPMFSVHRQGIQVGTQLKFSVLRCRTVNLVFLEQDVLLAACVFIFELYHSKDAYLMKIFSGADQAKVQYICSTYNLNLANANITTPSVPSPAQEMVRSDIQ